MQHRKVYNVGSEDPNTRSNFHEVMYCVINRGESVISHQPSGPPLSGLAFCLEEKTTETQFQDILQGAFSAWQNQ